MFGNLFVFHQVVSIDTDFQVNCIESEFDKHSAVFLLIYSFNNLSNHGLRELHLEAFDLILRVNVHNHSILQGLNVHSRFFELHPVGCHEFGDGCWDALNLFDILHISL